MGNLHDESGGGKAEKIIEEKERKGTLSVPQCERMKDLLDEFVSVYGTEKWAISTFDHNMSLINNYIVPIIGEPGLFRFTPDR